MKSRRDSTRKGNKVIKAKAKIPIRTLLRSDFNTHSSAVLLAFGTPCKQQKKEGSEEMNENDSDEKMREKNKGKRD